jgi:hypothetical protein
MRQDDGYPSVRGGRLSVSYMSQDDVICQSDEVGWRLSVSYMRQGDDYLSVT